MDSVVALFRTLANELRLRMLRCVFEQPGITVTETADLLAVSKDVASANLRVLVGAQLIDARPSGRVVHLHYPSREMCSDALAWFVLHQLESLWKRGGADINSIVAQLWNSHWAAKLEDPVQWSDVYQRLGYFFTAYTNLRRLLILRALATEGPCTADRLMAIVHMSPPAASRQLDKLKRRGLVTASGGDDRGVWRLVTSPGSAFQRSLHRTVMRELESAG